MCVHVDTVKTFYEVTRYITEYSLSDIKLTTPKVSSGNRYTFSIENKFIIQNFYHVSVNLVIRTMSFI